MLPRLSDGTHGSAVAVTAGPNGLLAGGLRRRRERQWGELIGGEAPPAADLDRAGDAPFPGHPRQRALMQAEASGSVLRPEQFLAVVCSKVWTEPLGQGYERVVVERVQESGKEVVAAHAGRPWSSPWWRS